MSGGVRVLVYYTAPETEHAAVLDAYRKVSDGMRGTPGLLSSQLLRSALDGDGFAVLSEWTDLPRFQVWEEGSRHKEQTSALRSYRDEGRGRGYEIYEVVDRL